MEAHLHPNPSPLLHHALKAQLPHSINLVYRTQHKNRTPHARVLATFPPSTSESAFKPSPDEIPNCWAAAYLDRSMRPETDLWLYTAGQVPGHLSSPWLFNSASSSPSYGTGTDLCPKCAQAICTLLDYISTLSVPPFNPANDALLEAAKQHAREYPETGPDVKYNPTTGSYLRHLLEPSVVTLGACHESIARLCEEAGLVRKEFPGLDMPLNKFFVRVADLPVVRKLPERLKWGEVRGQDVDIVRSRTAIPRAAETLKSLQSVAVFEEETDRLVAWTFLGLDGSLTTLHTEPEYRGRGIARAVASRIFREHVPGFAVDEEGNAWAHSDVYLDNKQSASVCRNLGGKPGMTIYWLRLDMAKAGALVK